MRNVLIFDTETTGLEPPEAETIELGAVLWNLREYSIVECYTTVIARTPPNIGNPAEPFNGIKSGLLKEAVTPRDVAWSRFADVASNADAVVAHSASFDRKFCDAEAHEGHPMRSMPWICTLEDVDWPCVTRLALGRAGSGSLVRLALAHGVAVVSAHRSIHDCLLLARLFESIENMSDRLEAALVRSQRPKDTFIAMVPREFNDELKVAGFHWDGARRVWWRYMAVEDADKLAFPVAFEHVFWQETNRCPKCGDQNPCGKHDNGAEVRT